MRRLFSATALLSLLLSGCTTQLRSFRAGSESQSNADVGIPYRLAASEFVFSVTHQLDSCDQGEPKIATELAFSTEPVGGELFYIPYEKLSSAFKTSDITVERYANGTLKSINASVTDKGPEVIASVGKTAFNIASLVSGVGIIKGGGESQDRSCTEVALKTLEALKQNNTSVKEVSKELVGYVREIERIEVRAALGAITDEDKSRLKCLQLLVTAQSADELKNAAKIKPPCTTKRTTGLENLLKTLKEANAKHIALLSVSYDVRWQPAGKMESFNNDQNGFGKDIGIAEKPYTQWAEQILLQKGKNIVTQNSLKLMLNLVTTPGANKNDMFDSDKSDDRRFGIYMQEPAPGQILACKAVAATPGYSACADLAKENTYLNKPVSIPQLGRVAVLPLKNGFGEDNNLQATFSATGFAEKIIYASKKSQAEAIAKSVEGLTDKAVTFAKAQAEQRAADEKAAQAAAEKAEKAELAELDKQLQIADKKAKLAKLTAEQSEGSVTNASTLAQLQSDVAVLELKVKLKKLTEDLDKKGN
jgi:hypothetical protein